MDWILIGFVTISTVGLLSWLKEGGKLIWGEDVVPSLVWWALMPLVAISSSLIYLRAPDWVTVATTGLALVQIAYENIVKLIKAKIDALEA